MSQHKYPAVTVAVPMYNEVRHIRQTLESLARQTYQHFNVLISDNASTDGTADVCKDFCAQYANFRYERLATNRGAAFNFQHTLGLSDSEYFMWLGAHDYLSNNFVELTALILKNHPDICIAGGLVKT